MSATPGLAINTNFDSSTQRGVSNYAFVVLILVHFCGLVQT